ncbi:hypothetical protein BT69DRAFT_1329186 [Atractiella rhizophila]|nr:hypothetical protein BT69DRAFT_1329186 [Atractiella rhizophila]
MTVEAMRDEEPRRRIHERGVGDAHRLLLEVALAPVPSPVRALLRWIRRQTGVHRLLEVAPAPAPAPRLEGEEEDGRYLALALLLPDGWRGTDPARVLARLWRREEDVLHLLDHPLVLAHALLLHTCEDGDAPPPALVLDAIFPLAIATVTVLRLVIGTTVPLADGGIALHLLLDLGVVDPERALKKTDSSPARGVKRDREAKEDGGSPPRRRRRFENSPPPLPASEKKPDLKMGKREEAEDSGSEMSVGSSN